ncbi:MAG: ABC transporter permease subunit [Treponema sp.]|jgi:putative aldouronate transport system permease protein|nr:ABC transporter permease subunit [Treponema sp.]
MVRREKAFIRLRKDLSMNRYVYLMAIPIVAYYFIFHYITMGGVIIAFQQYLPARGFFKSQWVGFKHFVDFLAGPYAVRTIKNTLLINIYSLVFGFPMPIIFALLLNEVNQGIFKKTVQTISYLPHFISLMVICGLLKDFSRTQGLFNQILGMFGLEPDNLLSIPRYFQPLYVGSGIWQTMGWGSIIYLATLSSVDPNLYEAAEIDGAGRFVKMLYITFPSLIPIITIQLIMRLGQIMSQGYEKVILLYNPLVYETADIISSYVYRRGLEEANYSVGAAVGLFNSLINIIILCSVNYTSRRVIKESLW